MFEACVDLPTVNIVSYDISCIFFGRVMVLQFKPGLIVFDLKPECWFIPNERLRFSVVN